MLCSSWQLSIFRFSYALFQASDELTAVFLFQGRSVSNSYFWTSRMELIGTKLFGDVASRVGSLILPAYMALTNMVNVPNWAIFPKINSVLLVPVSVAIKPPIGKHRLAARAAILAMNLMTNFLLLQRPVITKYCFLDWAEWKWSQNKMSWQIFCEIHTKIYTMGCWLSMLNSTLFPFHLILCAWFVVSDRFITRWVGNVNSYIWLGKLQFCSMWFISEFVRSQIDNRTLRLWIGLYNDREGQGWFWLDNSAYSREGAYWKYQQPNDYTKVFVQYKNCYI